MIPEQEPPAHSEAGLIPDDYDPLTADDLSAVRSVPPPALPSPPRSDVVPPKAGDAGATARGRAPSPAAGPAEGAGRHDGSLADVLAGAGLEGVAVTPELSRAFGQIFRVMVEGVMDVLQARQRLRDEFRIGVPTFRPTDNNPLKFSANVEDAVNNLLVKRNAAYLGPFDAFEDAFDDLRHDQMAMLVGMRAAFDAIVAQFEPDRLQEIFDRQLKTGGFVPMPAKMRYWDLYRLRFDEIAKDPDVTFQAFFASVFIKASEEQLERLKNKGRTRRR